VLVEAAASLPANGPSVRHAGRRTAGLRLATPLAVVFAVALAVPSGDATAAALRGSATPIAAMVLLATLLAVREWPVELVGSAWAVGTLFAAAVYLVGSRYRPALFWLASKSLVRRTAFARFNPASVVSQDLTPPRERALIAAKQCFLALQAAWDVGDIEALRARTTPQMLDDLLQELPMRGAGPNRTDVVTLDAVMLAFELIGHRYVASVEFSGMIRECAEQGAAPFREVWMLTCADDDMRDWRLVRQQALL